MIDVNEPYVCEDAEAVTLFISLDKFESLPSKVRNFFEKTPRILRVIHQGDEFFVSS